MALEIGEVLANRYKVEEFLKSESGADLWQARDMILRRGVLIRNVKDMMLDNVRYITRFAHDAQVLAQLEHPHIVPIHDYGVHKENPFQIQRYIGVSTLEDFFKGRSVIDTTSQLRLLQQIASALDYIHERGIVHRDFQAHNITLDERKTPYLANFGLAVLADGHDLVIDSMIDKQTSISDDRANDIYAYGLLVHQVLTHGETPQYRGQELVNTLYKHRPELPLQVDLVVNRLLNKEIEHRYLTAGKAIDDLFDAFYSGQSNIEGKIFISYARKDREYVYKLANELKNIGLDVWIDSDIRTGTSWADDIQNALNDCDMMLLIITDASMESDYVTHEWSYLMGRGKSVYPFVPSGKLPERIHPRLEHFQFSFGTDDMLNNVARIVDVLAGGTPTKLGSSDT